MECRRVIGDNRTRRCYSQTYGGSCAMKYLEFPVEQLRLPQCPLPRPGDRVTWFSGVTRRFGTFLGHRTNGKPCVISDENAPVMSLSFEELRLADPFKRIGPNWTK